MRIWCLLNRQLPVAPSDTDQDAIPNASRCLANE